MHTDEASDLLYECVLVKVSKHEFILDPVLSRKRKHPNYKSLDSYFQVDGQPMLSERHCLNLPKVGLRVRYFEALDLIMVSLRTTILAVIFCHFLKI